MRTTKNYAQEIKDQIFEAQKRKLEAEKKLLEIGRINQYLFDKQNDDEILTVTSIDPDTGQQKTRQVSVIKRKLEVQDEEKQQQIIINDANRSIKGLKTELKKELKTAPDRKTHLNDIKLAEKEHNVQEIQQKVDAFSQSDHPLEKAFVSEYQAKLDKAKSDRDKFKAELDGMRANIQQSSQPVAQQDPKAPTVKTQIKIEGTHSHHVISDFFHNHFKHDTWYHSDDKKPQLKEDATHIEFKSNEDAVHFYLELAKHDPKASFEVKDENGKVVAYAKSGQLFQKSTGQALKEGDNFSPKAPVQQTLSFDNLQLAPMTQASGVLPTGTPPPASKKEEEDTPDLENQTGFRI